MLYVLGWALLVVVVLGLAWQSIVHRRLYLATGLHTFLYGQWMFGLGAVTMAVAFGAGAALEATVNRSWAWESVTTLVQIYMAATMTGMIALVCLWTAGQFHRLFREYYDWRSVVTGMDLPPAAEVRRWLGVHLTGRVPDDAEVLHVPTWAPCWTGGLAAVLLLLGPIIVMALMGGVSETLTGEQDADLLILTPLVWVLIIAFAVCGAIMLSFSLSCIKSCKIPTR